jgi:thiol-disulfide isomerase/thioredoxin
MKKYSILALLFFTIISISSFSQKKTTIKGKLLNNKAITEVYLENVLNEEQIATSKIDDKGLFSFDFSISKPDFYRVRVDEQLATFFVVEPGENIEAEINMDDFQNPIIKGSKNSSLIYTILAENTKKDKELEDYTAKITAEKRQIAREMIKNNPKSLSCLFFTSELDPAEDMEYFKMLADGLKEYSDNPMVIDLMSKVTSNASLAIGGEAPEIALADKDGKIIKLSSLRGKYVLIDFWAAWCRPCRKESPNMVKLYNQYNKKGFEIYSVSLDNVKEDWLGAITQDGLGAWTHVSDLQYWDSEAAKTYNIQAIPYTILLDKEVKIIAKELRGEDLEKKLAEILK